MHPSFQRAAGALIALAAVIAPAVAAAQVPSRRAATLPSRRSDAPPDAGELRLRYGISFREGLQESAGPLLTYSGRTENDLSLGVSYFGERPWGGVATVQREAFAFFDEARSRVTGGSVTRASLAPAARAFFGPVRAELSLGYAFAQLPTLGSALAPAFETGTRHALAAGGRVVFPIVWRLRGELRGEYPLTLSARDGAGRPATSSGFSAGAGLILPVRVFGRWSSAAVFDYSYVQDPLTAGSGFRAEQKMSKVGLALQLAYRGRHALPRPLETGDLRVRVLDEATGAPLAGAEVTLVVEGQALPPRAVGPDGQLVAEELEAGEVLARVSPEGYLPVEARGVVGPGEERTVELRARKAPPRVGALRVKVLGEGAAPLAGARIKVGDREAVSDAAGAALFEGLPPGPVEVAITARGYRPGAEAASVVADRQAELSATLTPVKKREPATLTGNVRSSRGGQPIKALLEIPEAKVRTPTGADGRFLVRLDPGTYRVIISAPGFLTQNKTLVVREGEQAIFNVDLFPSSR